MTGRGFLFDPSEALPPEWVHVAGISARSAGRWHHSGGWMVRAPKRGAFALVGPMGEPVPCDGRPTWPSLRAIAAWVAERQAQTTMF